VPGFFGTGTGTKAIPQVLHSFTIDVPQGEGELHGTALGADFDGAKLRVNGGVVGAATDTLLTH
jgi:hypothetical protein